MAARTVDCNMTCLWWRAETSGKELLNRVMMVMLLTEGAGSSTNHDVSGNIPNQASRSIATHDVSDGGLGHFSY